MLNTSLKSKAASAFSLKAAHYQDHAYIQREVADELISMMPIKVGTLLDLGAGPFVNSEALKQRANQVISLDLSRTMLSEKRTPCVVADMDSMPFLSQSFNCVFSNFAMQWSSDIKQLLSEIERVLVINGKAFLTLLIDGTLAEFNHAFSAIDNKQHVNKFITEGELTNLLAIMPFSSAVTIKTHVALYGSARDAFGSVKAIGANVKQSETKRLSKQDYQTLLAAYPRSEVQYPVSYKVAYLELTK